MKSPQTRAIVFYVSGHGLGHLSQTGPVIDAFYQRHPDIDIVIVTAVNRLKILERLHSQTQFTHVQLSTDPGLLMQSALVVDRCTSAAAYQRYAADFAQLVAIERERLTAVGAVGVFSNVSWLPLVAAQSLGLPALAMSSLNWADMLEHYCANQPKLTPLIKSGRAAYNSADAFILPQPSIPMPSLTNTVAVNPVVQLGSNHRAALKTKFGLTHKRIGLVSTGGIDMPMDLRQWDQNTVGSNQWLWLVNDDAVTDGTNFQRQGATGVSFPDLLASADVVICKPGYGIFTEAVATHTPILYLSRDDWPEQPHLLNWARRFVPCEEITLDNLLAGCFEKTLNAVCENVKAHSHEHTHQIELNGQDQVCDLIDKTFKLTL